MEGEAMLINTAALIVAIVMAVWIYQVVNRHGGKLPWLWAAGAFVLWPLVATIAGYKHDEASIMVVGIIGLCLFVLSIVVALSLVPIMF
jgi:hypothetical protein